MSTAPAFSPALAPTTHGASVGSPASHFRDDL